MKVAVVSGLGNTRRLMEALEKGRVSYDFVEVMACPGGCAGGGGQPISEEDQELAEARGKTLYELDSARPVRFSHENMQARQLYRDYLGSPGSELAEQLLHTDHFGWDMPGAAALH